MKFKDILYEWLLVENKEDVYEKYYSDIDRNTFIRIIKSDPKTIVNDQNQIIQFGKHSRLLLEIFRKGHLRFEDLVKATEYLTIVYQHNITLDYKKINTISDIFEYVKHKISKIAVNINQILESLNPDEYEIKYNGSSWFIVTPKTERAAAYLGVNTEWCTAWGKHSLNPKYKERTNHFLNHYNQGPLYIIVDKSNINNKFQLHFETNQLKGVSDNEESNRPKFFDEKPEVKLFLFPSLSEKNGIGTLKKDMDLGKKFLSRKDIQILLEKFVENFGDPTNNLYVDFLNGNVDSILVKIGSDQSLTELSFNDEDVTFEFRKLPPSLDGIYRGISYYEQEKSYSYDRSYEDESYYFKEESGEDILGNYLENFHEKNKSELTKVFGNVAKSFESFKMSFINHLVNDRKVSESYLEKYAELTSLSYDAAIDSELRKIELTINFDMGYGSFSEANVSLVKILEFISEKNITSLEDLDDFFEDFGDYYDLPDEDFYVDIEYDRKYPDNDYMNDVFEEYFERQQEESKDYNEYSEECVKIRNKFINVVNDKFDNNDTFENEFVKIEIEPNWLSSFDCEKGVDVNFTNKKSNETHNGYMQVDSVINNITMEPLFERLIKNIMKEVKRQAK